MKRGQGRPWGEKDEGESVLQSGKKRLILGVWGVIAPVEAAEKVREIKRSQMSQVMFVKRGHRTYLANELARILFAKSTVRDNVVKKFAAADVLDDHVTAAAVRVVEELDELDNVGMI